jgi:hypothetical protein
MGNSSDSVAEAWEYLGEVLQRSFVMASVIWLEMLKMHGCDEEYSMHEEGILRSGSKFFGERGEYSKSVGLKHEVKTRRRINAIPVGLKLPHSPSISPGP